MSSQHCRFCASGNLFTFTDLGMSPVSNAFLTEDRLNAMEPFYPLKASVCSNCFLVQVDEFESPEQIFTDNYPYFSSVSSSWLKHSEEYTINMIERFNISAQSKVVEVASNDGYLLQFFKAREVAVLGVEPSSSVAKVAREKGIPTLERFFGVDTARELLGQGHDADLMIANNVLAHTPKLNDFVAGFKILLKKTGVATFEFPHVMNLIQKNQFDTIYHEHFSYFSLLTVKKLMEQHGLKVFDVEELETHGGSLRVLTCHFGDTEKAELPSVQALLTKEKRAGLDDLKTYQAYTEKVQYTKYQLLEFLISEKKKGKLVVGYGAPAKGNTLLNYCGIHSDLVKYTVDKSPYKQGMFLPGTHIAIHDPSIILADKPDFVLILPWNIKEEVMEAMKAIRSWDGKFVVPIPELQVL
jgi:SAM-dependent methyltransferase